MAQESTPESAGSARPFKYNGNQGEFTLLAPLKPGGAEKARQIARKAVENFSEISAAITALARFTTFGLPSSTTTLACCSLAIYDGTWDQYIDDFAAGVAAGSLPFLDELWENLEGYPGLNSPDVKDYLVKYQVPIGFFWTAQPDSTVKRNLRAERVLAGIEQVLDAAG